MVRINALGIVNVVLVSAMLSGCNENNPVTEDDSSVNNVSVPTAYVFGSRFATDSITSSVSYGGQNARHLLIEDLKGRIGAISEQNFDTEAEAMAYLNFLYNTSDDHMDNGIEVTASPAVLQTTYRDFSSSNKNLSGKIYTDSTLGWGDGTKTPNALIQEWLGIISANVVSSDNRTDPSGAVIDADKPYLAADGVDYQQMTQKFLLGAVAYSQAMDKYLDEKLTTSDNTVGDKEGTKPYSALEHAWDEAFGYFGAARDYSRYSALALSGKDEDGHKVTTHPKTFYKDSNGDGSIDLQSEYNFGHSTNAGKRDAGSQISAKTEYTHAIFTAFLKGRALISSNTATATEIEAQREIIANNWEKAIAATVIHYINEVLGDMNDFDSGDYSFSSHAKHWSEMKGFALGLQFNPHKLISNADLATVHSQFADKPVLSSASAAEKAAYVTALTAARAVLAAAYRFADANVEGW